MFCQYDPYHLFQHQAGWPIPMANNNLLKQMWPAISGIAASWFIFTVVSTFFIYLLKDAVSTFLMKWHVHISCIISKYNKYYLITFQIHCVCFTHQQILFKKGTVHRYCPYFSYVPVLKLCVTLSKSWSTIISVDLFCAYLSTESLIKLQLLNFT